MANTNGLRYSPVNWLIIDWHYKGQQFNDCGLPQPYCEPAKPTPAPKACEAAQEIIAPIDTYDWGKFLPNVTVGITDADDDIAADYTRQAAIDFARYAMVLQREVVIHLQPGVQRYPIIPFDGEQIEGVIAAKLNDQHYCTCVGSRGKTLNVEYSLYKNEITVDSKQHDHGVLKLLVWVAPTEDACTYDAFLYDKFRREITMMARREYVMVLHYKDKNLKASLPEERDYLQARLGAKSRALGVKPVTRTEGSGLWEQRHRMPGAVHGRFYR